MCSSTMSAPSAAEASIARELRLDEERHANAGALELADDPVQMSLLADDVEAAFGRALLAPLRHEAAGIGDMAQRDLEHLRRRRHLEVQRPRQLGLETGDVGIRDVAPVLAQMRRNAVGAGLDREMRGAQGIGMTAAASIADGCDVIDVDAEAQRGTVPSRNR